MTGFNLPPGCSVRDLPGYTDSQCEMCGRYPDDCLCPECPVCSSFGDPRCYRPEYPVKFWCEGIENDGEAPGHGLTASAFQIASLAEAQAELHANIEAENAYWSSLSTQ